MMHRLATTFSFALLIASAAPAVEPDPAAAAAASSDSAPVVPDLSVFPDLIQLQTSRDYQSFIAVVRRDDDVTLDVTAASNWKLADETFARIEGNRVVPVADGETELICQYGSGEVRIPVKVSRSGETPPISFEKDIVPILTRSGCNTGSCHGAASGKDGFMISLFGYDPAGDYRRITREIGMRRINLAVPEESLFLTKATGKVPHTGGKLFDPDSVYYAMILEWLKPVHRPIPHRRRA